MDNGDYFPEEFVASIIAAGAPGDSNYRVIHELVEMVGCEVAAR